MSLKLVKVVCVVLSIMMCLTALVGCGTKKEDTVSEKKDSSPATNSESSKAEEPIEITYWNGFTGPDGPVLEELVKKFNETNGKIVVKMDIMPWDSLRQKLASTLAVGQGPDIIAFHTENIGTYAKPGMVAELDDLYGPDGIDINVIPKALAENLKYNGKFYGAPMNFATLMLYYNKDLFKDAGLDPEKPPKNWDELKDYAIKLTKVSNGTVEQYGFGVATRETIPMWPILIWGNGGDLIDIENKKAVINSEKTIEAVQIWSDLIKNNHISPPTMTGAEVDKLFESQKCAMYMCGPWAVNGFKNAGINFGVAPVPAGPAGEVTLGNGVAMMMAKSSKNKDAVYEFFKYWISKETQIYWALNTGFPPARTDLEDDSSLKENPYVVAFSSVANTAKFYLQQLTNYASIENDCLVPALESILLGKSGVKEALDKCAEEMDKLLKE